MYKKRYKNITWESCVSEDYNAIDIKILSWSTPGKKKIYFITFWSV
jgi:hypothetical protein